MKPEYTLLVIGAGPAGIAAALTAARHGIDVGLVDEQAHPGGQIYRNVDASPLQSTGFLGGDYLHGRPLVRGLRQAQVGYLPDSSVWYLDPRRELGILRQGRHCRAHAEIVIIATGAQERPLPFPGWQLPGVMGAGAAQVLLKSAALVPARPAVLAGSGPLLLLLASQYLRAGVPIGALVETTPAGNRRRALAHLPRALAGADYLLKGLHLVAALRRARIPWYRGVSAWRACGEARLEALEFEHAGGAERIDTDLLLVHHGVVPSFQLAAAADCALEWNDLQQCWQTQRDVWGETTQAGVYVAGDAAGIGGARVAELDGRLAALQAVCALGRIDAAARERLARPLKRARARHLAVRPFLDTYYRVPDNALLPADGTLVCRCEELGAAELRRVAALGAGPNQAKAFTRCGMGPCQGRSCGATLERICAQFRGTTERLRVRPPMKPVTLGQLAGVEEIET